MTLDDMEHGSLIIVDGAQWVGITSLGGATWLAYKLGDPNRVICMVMED
jgi:hypothetical protein